MVLLPVGALLFPVGDRSSVVPPSHTDRAVKPSRADGTARFPCGRVGRCRNFFPSRPGRAFTRAAGRRFLGLVLCHPGRGNSETPRWRDDHNPQPRRARRSLMSGPEGGGLPNSISATLMDSGSRANSFRKFRNELPQGHRAGTLKKTPAARDICAESRSQAPSVWKFSCACSSVERNSGRAAVGIVCPGDVTGHESRNELGRIP